MEETQHVEVEVRRELSARGALTGFLVLVLLVASCAVWGPTWILHAAQWVLDNVAKPLGSWIADKMQNAPTDVSPSAPGADTPLP